MAATWRIAAVDGEVMPHLGFLQWLQAAAAPRFLAWLKAAGTVAVTNFRGAFREDSPYVTAVWQILSAVRCNPAMRWPHSRAQPPVSSSCTTSFNPRTVSTERTTST